MNKKELSSLILFKPHQNWDYVIDIDNNLSSIEEICNLFGKTFYQLKPDSNPIISGTTYFGGNLMSFIDCFESYLFNNKETNIKINIHSKNNSISDSEMWAFITCFFIFISNKSYLNDSNWHTRLGVYVSLEIYEIINREFNKNSWMKDHIKELFELIS